MKHISGGWGIGMPRNIGGGLGGLFIIILVSILLLLAVVSGISLAGVRLQLFGEDSGEILQGYEGAKLFFWGYRQESHSFGITQSPLILYTLGATAPQGVATWVFRADNFNVDALEEKEYWQNLIGIVDTNGKVLRQPGNILGEGALIYQEVKWDIATNINASATQIRHILGRIYYFDSEIELKVQVDEALSCFAGLCVAQTTEKDDPARNFQIILRSHVNNWDPIGNRTSWAAIVGVEVVSVTLRDQAAPNIDLSTQFRQGQMVSMYSTIQNALTGSGSITKPDTTAYLNGRRGNDIAPAPDLAPDAFVSLGFNVYGVNCCPEGDKWDSPQLRIVLRTHVLKVEEWIAIQLRSVPADWSQEERVHQFTLFSSLGAWFSNPFNQLALAIGSIIAILVLVLVATPVGSIAGVYLAGRRR